MQPLPVFLATNDAYACFAATTMMSIADHARAAVHFHLFADGIGPARREKLVRALAPYPHAVLAIHGDLDRSLDDCTTAWYPTAAVFARYFIADRFPEYGLCLYADCDMIFRIDVAEIFALGVGGHGLAACGDGALHTVVDVPAHKRRLGIPEEHVYFNNGLLLIDAEYWRRTRVTDALMRVTSDVRDVATFPSQDPFNIVFSPNRYRLLPPRYNVMPSVGPSDCDPAVIHYTWPKPWCAPHSAQADRFWDVARRGPFAGEIRRTLWRWRSGAPARWLRNAWSRPRTPPAR